MSRSIVQTKDTIIVRFNDGTLKHISTQAKNASKVKELYGTNASDADLKAAMDVRELLKMHDCGMFGVDENGNIVVIGTDEEGSDEIVPKSLGERLVQFATAGLDISPLVKFWHNCQANPNPVAKSDLFKFLEHHGHPITEDGCFMAYKYVSKTDAGGFTDSHTQTMSIVIGQPVSMNRDMVDSDRNQTCSTGLHVAAYEYVRNQQYILEVKVNPKDVCAIPTDYNGQKMRVCEYLPMKVNEKILPDLPENACCGNSCGMCEDDEEDLDEDMDAAEDLDEDLDESVNDRMNRVPVHAGHDGWKRQKRDDSGRFVKKALPKRDKNGRFV